MKANWTMAFASAGSLLLIGATLHGPKAARGTVTFVLSTDCPVAASYTPRIQNLAKTYESQGFTFRAIFPNDLESADKVNSYMKARGYTFPSQMDFGAVEAKRLGVKMVPTAVVTDASGKVVYRGAIDNNKDVTLVKHTYLSDALAALAAGKSPAVESAPAFGCLLMPGKPVPSKADVNYAADVAPILKDHCISCHREGEVAPFTLTDFETAKKWAPMVADRTASRQMPPWKAVAGFGEFQHENRLTDQEIETIKRWSEAGAPSGDLSKAPELPTFKPGWTLGDPDMVLTPSKPHTLAAEGADEYRNYVLDPKNKETLWVRGMDVRPGNRKVVHHVIAFIDTTGTADKLAAKSESETNSYVTFGGPGFLPHGSLGGWAPGVAAYVTDGTKGFEVPPGAKVVMQVHYHRDGVQETDQTKLGLYLCKEPPKQRMELAWILTPFFRIPAGAKNFPVELNYTIQADSTIYGAMPHMHLLGQSMKAVAKLPDGTEKPLVWVKDWDFNWQIQYMFKDPIQLPKGTKIHVSGTYDNSTDNPNNPRKVPQPVTWGEQTTDEMFLLIVPFTLDNVFVGKK